ncbi:MAG TPA: TonB-dependent receptor [Acidobacteriaceae bacterium]
MAAALAFSAVQAASAQGCTSGTRVSGIVLDPSRAAVVGAEVTLRSTGDASPLRMTTDANGRFLFACAPTASRTVHVEAQGFAPADVRPGPGPLTIAMAIATVQTDVQVGDSSSALDTDHGAGTHTLNTKDVQDLADDPDDFRRQLQVLAATSGGAPGAAIITIDGFQNSSQLPPKSSIASIRINPDMFSSEYGTPPYRGGRIEIYTKPGLDRFHGALFYTDSQAAFNANDPYSVAGTPAGKRRYGFELSGPILARKSDFSLNLEKRDIDEFNVVNAVVLDSQAAPQSLRQSVSAPQRLWIASARADWQVNAKNIANLAYTANVSNLGNQGVGGLSLQEAGYATTIGEQNLRLTNTQAFSPNLLHETHIGYTWKNTVDTPNSTAPSLQVAGAFTGGGATSQTLENRERDVEVDDDLMITHRAHSFKLGVQALGVFAHVTDPDTFNGAFVFGGGVAPNLGANGQPASGTSVISGLEQYRRAVAGLAGGVPTTYQITTGNALVPFTQWRLALYAQDAWKLSPRLSVSYGLRYAFETSPASFANLAPRVGIAWSPDKKQKWVIHLRAGLFNTPVDQATTLDAYRLNGARQSETLIYSPSYSAPLTPTESSIAIGTTHSFARHAGETPSFQSQAGVEYDLPHHWHVQANLFYAAAWKSLRSRNINAPLAAAGDANPLLAPRPLAPDMNLFQYQQTGNLHGSVTFVGVDQHTYKRFNIFVGYLHYDLMTDADSPGQFPESSYTDHQELARADWESSNRLFTIGQLNLPGKLSLSTQFDAASGLPYNVVTGTDNNGDGIFNNRPSYAASPGDGVYSTRFGLLSTSAVNGDLPRNAGTMPATVHVDANLSRTFNVAAKGSRDRHETLTLNARSANLINHTNVTAVGTVVGSPTFAQSLAAETARRIELGARFTF